MIGRFEARDAFPSTSLADSYDQGYLPDGPSEALELVVLSRVREINKQNTFKML